MTNDSRPRALLRLRLADLESLWSCGIDVRPNCHAWVDDASIREALASGVEDDLWAPHTPETNRAVRIATFVRRLKARGVKRRLYAELYFRGTALRLKVIDGNTRWRAMQFARDPETIELHIFGQENDLATLPAAFRVG